MQTPGPFGEVSASRGGEGAKGRSRWSRNGQSLLAAGPVVRIHLPPAASQVRTCLSREFAFLRREAAVFRGCAPFGWRRGRRRRAGWSNIAPRNGNISVGPYSSTAVLPARFRDRGGDGSQGNGVAPACRFRVGGARAVGPR